MKTRLVLTLILVLFGFKTPAAGTETNDPNTAYPLILMDDVALSDGVKNLARYAGINYILDPAVLESFAGPDGPFSREPRINSRWTNVTAQRALEVLLRAYRLTMVTNPVTGVARIAFLEQKVAPVAAGQLGSDATVVKPLIIMEDVPLVYAIQNLAREAKIPYVLDSTLNSATRPSGDTTLVASIVNIRWKNITLKQALVALLDDYGLMMVQDPGDATIRIMTKPGSGPAPQGNHGGGQPKNNTVIRAI